MNAFVLCMIIFSTFAGNVSAKVNCTVKADGNYGDTCSSYVTCTGGVSGEPVQCPAQTVYNKITGQCDDPVHVIPPCGTLLNCSITPDGSYADKTSDCKQWYTCHEKNYKGHTPCPGGTVYDEELQTCNYKMNVAPPCGTKVGF